MHLKIYIRLLLHVITLFLAPYSFASDSWTAQTYVLEQIRQGKPADFLDRKTEKFIEVF